MSSFKKYTRLKKVGKTYIYFIIRNGYYPEFVKWCTTHEKLNGRKQNLKAYLFLKSKKLLEIFYSSYEILFLNNWDMKAVYRIAQTSWL